MVTINLMKVGAAAAALGGALWTFAPLPGVLINVRILNAFFLLPILFLLIGLLTLQNHQYTDHGLVGMVGVVLSMTALGMAGVGATIQALFPPFQQAQFGVNGNVIFLGGFYLLLVGAVILGIALWLSPSIDSRPGIALLATVPIAIVGFFAFNELGVEQFNWAPYTVPYGVAWVVIGYQLWIDPGQTEVSDSPVE